MQESIKVSICCLTFNHAKYIKQCFDGFLMQKTEFKYEILVHDDASVDGTIDIINEYSSKYPNLIKPYIQKENQYSKGNGFVGLTINFNRAQGKYIALCEGDDYWTDTRKLQKQFDYLESHPECSLCTHAHYNDKNGTLSEFKRYDHDVDNCSLEDIMLIGGGFAATNSMMFKSSFVKQEFPRWYKISTVADLALLYWLKIHGDVAYLSSPMSAYRIASNGSWTQQMGSDWKKRNLFFRKGVEMHIELDRWTEGKYHTIISKKIKQIKKLKHNENISQVKRWILRFLNR